MSTSPFVLRVDTLVRALAGTIPYSEYAPSSPSSEDVAESTDGTGRRGASSTVSVGIVSLGCDFKCACK